MVGKELRTLLGDESALLECDRGDFGWCLEEAEERADETRVLRGGREVVVELDGGGDDLEEEALGET